MLSIAAVACAYKAQAGEKEKDARFTAGPAASYTAHQTNGKVTIGAEPFYQEDKVRTAFGKNDPNKSGVLPILVVIQNDTGKAMRADHLKLEYIGPDRSRVTATPAGEVKFLTGPQRPNVMAGPTGVPKVLKRKNPLNSWEIEGRAFSARMIPPGESASGFFYFETAYHSGSRLYLTGLTEADTGTELLYFEIPFE